MEWPRELDSVGRAHARVARGVRLRRRLTDHKAFDFEAIVDGADLVVDSRNAIKRHAPHVFKIGAPTPARELRDREPQAALAQAG